MFHPDATPYPPTYPQPAKFGLIDALVGMIPGDLLGWSLAGVLLAMACIVGIPLLFGAGRRTPGLYQSRRILTPNETEFYNRMIEALPGYVVHTQIAMSALIEPRIDRWEDGSEYMRRRAKFSQKYVDFVICRPGKLDVVAIVELDDITHEDEKDAERDEMLQGAFYNVVRWHSRRKPSKDEIYKTIRRLDRRQPKDPDRVPSR